MQGISEVCGTNLTASLSLDNWDGCMVDVRAQEPVCLCLCLCQVCSCRALAGLMICYVMLVAHVRSSGSFTNLYVGKTFPHQPDWPIISYDRTSNQILFDY